jgi:hypothetical protein
VLLILRVPGGRRKCFVHEEKQVERQCTEVCRSTRTPILTDGVFVILECVVMMCTAHREYVAVYIVMTFLGI